MIFNLQEMDVKVLHNNLVTQTQILELLHNGMFPGAAHKHLDRSISYTNTLRNKMMDEFRLRPEAKELAPEIFKENDTK